MLIKMLINADKFHPERPVLIGHSPCVVAKHDTQQLIDYHVDELFVSNFLTKVRITKQIYIKTT